VRVTACAPPTAAPTQSPPANSAGWNNTNVTVTWNWAAAVNGPPIDVTNCPTTSPASGEGVILVTATCYDTAGTSTKATYTVKLDTIPPTVAVTGVADGAVYPAGAVPGAGCSTSDALSDVATSATVSFSYGPSGSVTATCSGGTDNAGNTADPVSVTYTVLGTPLTTHTQAMDGDLKVAQWSTLSAGFDFTIPGNHPDATVAFLGTTVTFNATCASGTPGNATIVVPITGQSYSDPANSSAWYPSGDQNDSSTYQGSVTVPGFCDPGALVRLQQGGTFSTSVSSTDSQDKVNVRWHYQDDGTGGGWSGTYGVTPS
jgi:hypothetical protein